MKSEEFKKLLNERINEFELHLYNLLPAEEGFAKTVREAMNYSIKAGGKRLRPLLLTEVCRLLHGSVTEEAWSFASAIELIHTYSLVHDDLPAMDNDDLRRGKPTTHKKFGEAMGILAGDALLNYSVEVAASTFKNTTMPENVGMALCLLYEKSGINGMIGGQVADVEAEKAGEDITREKLEYIYANKTGALIEAAMMTGCLLAPEADGDVMYVMGEAAERIGLAFQIQDDILDVAGDEKELGKPVGSDERNDKSTYVRFEGIEKAREDSNRLINEAIDMLKPYANEDDFLIALIKSTVERRN